MLVAGVGVAVRAPLARVPENAMKFAVGVMLTTFGIFWSVEGAGADWPGDDAALLGVLGFVVALLVRPRAAASARAARSGAGMKRLAAFGRFWWDFVIGDDWLVAVLVAAAIGATAVLAAAGVAAWWLLPLAVPVVLWLSLRRAIRSA